MAVPHFLKVHKLDPGDAESFEKCLADTYMANTWVRSMRKDADDLSRYDWFGKALVWELCNGKRRSVIELLRGAYNRARLRVEQDLLLEELND